MTVYDFKALSEEQQKEAVQAHGVHIGTRHARLKTIALYQIEGFYVEVSYSQEVNMVVRIRSFVSTDKLKPYLKHIDLSLLVKQ